MFEPKIHGYLGNNKKVFLLTKKGMIYREDRSTKYLFWKSIPWHIVYRNNGSDNMLIVNQRCMYTFTNLISLR